MCATDLHLVPDKFSHLAPSIIRIGPDPEQCGPEQISKQLLKMNLLNSAAAYRFRDLMVFFSVHRLYSILLKLGKVKLRLNLCLKSDSHVLEPGTLFT